jgi:hypothetical protein
MDMDNAHLDHETLILADAIHSIIRDDIQRKEKIRGRHKRLTKLVAILRVNQEKKNAV